MTQCGADISLLGYRVCVCVCVPAWPVSAGPRFESVVVRLSKGYCHCDRLSSSLNRLLNLPDTRHTTLRWQSVGRIVGTAVIGQAGKETPGIYCCFKFNKSGVWCALSLTNFVMKWRMYCLVVNPLKPATCTNTTQSTSTYVKVSDPSWSNGRVVRRNVGLSTMCMLVAAWFCNLGQGLVILEVSRSHTTTHHSQ